MKKKEYAQVLLASLLAILAPVLLAWYRAQPPHAQSAEKLWVQTFAQARHEIEAELGKRDSKLVTAGQMAERWEILRQSMQQQGASAAETNKVLSEAKYYWYWDNNQKPLPQWPIFVRRGYVRGKSVWIAVVAVQADKSENAEIFTGWDYAVRVVDPQKPSEVSSLYATNSVFPRCYGPNTPFPVAQ